MKVCLRLAKKCRYPFSSTNSNLAIFFSLPKTVLIIFSDTWRLTLKCLQDELSSKPATAPEHEAWYSAMQEILDHLAKNLVLESFLDILPGPQNTEDFQSYIQLCRKNQQAHQIQNLIVNTGHKLLSTLTF